MKIREAIWVTYARLEQEVFQVAEAMPAEYFSFRPTDEVRTFGEQLRHIGAVQWVVGCAVSGQELPVDVGDGDSGPREMNSKPAIMEYARGSFTCIQRAVQAMESANALEEIPHPYAPETHKIVRLALLAGYACHGWEHYGQMVVYQRLKGIVPPPSRPELAQL